MSELIDKEQIIKKVYNNTVSGFGSVRDTYVQANSINPGITYLIVKEYFSKQPHKQTNIVVTTLLYLHTLCLKLKLI